jgi:glycolate oxidase
MNNWLPKLRRLFPASQISTQPEALDTYGTDMWHAKKRPDVVFFPRKAQDVAKLLKFASHHKIPVTARGAGKGYVGGCVPEHAGIVVALEKMNRILEINFADGVAVVQPGVITGDLQKAVEKVGLFYPPDPASLKDCFMGGNVATNAGGPRCVKYGVTRHYVLGLQVALANGQLVRVGGRTHKNKSGFDLVGMFVGSEGLLGIVTEITVRLLPLPRSRAVFSAGFRTAAQAAAAVQNILASGFLPSALEVADKYTLQAARKYLGGELVPPGSACLIVEIDGQPASVRSEAKKLLSVIRRSGGLQIRSALNERDAEKIWDLRRGFSTSLKSTGLSKLNEDVTVPRGRLVDLFNFAGQLQKKYGLPVASFGHAGDGNIHVNIMVDLTKPGVKPKMRRALDDLFDQVLAWNGSITGEHGIGLAKLRWWKKAASPELRALHKTIKKALDPEGLLNPGKFV